MERKIGETFEYEGKKLMESQTEERQEKRILE